MISVNRLIPNYIYQQLQEETRLNTILSNCLSVDIINSISFQNNPKNTLTITSNNPATANRLRYYSDTILSELKQTEFSHIKKVKVINRPGSIPLHGTQQKTMRSGFSKSTADLLQSTAQSINHDPLRDALSRLAAHCK